MLFIQDIRNNGGIWISWQLHELRGQRARLGTVQQIKYGSEVKLHKRSYSIQIVQWYLDLGWPSLRINKVVKRLVNVEQGSVDATFVTIALSFQQRN